MEASEILSAAGQPASPCGGGAGIVTAEDIKRLIRPPRGRTDGQSRGSGRVGEGGLRSKSPLPGAGSGRNRASRTLRVRFPPRPDDLYGFIEYPHSPERHRHHGFTRPTRSPPDVS